MYKVVLMHDCANVERLLSQRKTKDEAVKMAGHMWWLNNEPRKLSVHILSPKGRFVSFVVGKA